MEGDALAPVLDRPGFHLHAVGDQFPAMEIRPHPVQYMIAGTLDVGGDLGLPGLHALHIQVPCASDQVARVGIFTRQPVGHQVAAVVQIGRILVDHAGIFGLLKARRFDACDRPSGLSRHQFRPQAAERFSRTPQPIQSTVGLKGLVGDLLPGEGRLVAIHRFPGIARILQRRLLRSLRQNEPDARKEEEYQDPDLPFLLISKPHAHLFLFLGIIAGYRGFCHNFIFS